MDYERPISRAEVDEKIEDAIRQHNRNASIISMYIGFFFLGAFMDGMFRLLGFLPPFMDIDISLIPQIVDKVKDVLQ